MSLPPDTRRILFDCSATFQSNSRRGIPRVVRSILRHAPDIAREYCGTAVAISYAFHGWSETSLAELDESAPSCQQSALATSLVERLCRLVPSRKLRRLLLPPPGRDGIWKLTRLLRNNALGLYHRLKRRSISPGAGDVLVLFDCWLRAPDSFWRHVAKARRRGARVVTVVYDLIPVTHPDFVGPKPRTRFRAWMHQVAQHSDAFAAISESVKSELQTFLNNTEPWQAWSDDRFSSFMLGCEIRTKPGGQVREKVVRAFDSGLTYLMVGALEPRKNQTFLLDGFERLWQNGEPLKLCFVGGDTRSVPALSDRLNHHRERDTKLFYFSDLSDVELDYCYRHTRALVFPSIIEGFGLPIVEALQHGKDVLASDTPIHREVGRGFCDYFELGCLQSLTTKILELERRQQAGNSRTKCDFKATTWNASCRELLEICFRGRSATTADRQQTVRAA